MITVDQKAAYPKVFAQLIAPGELHENVELRQKKYQGNIVEQDHPGHKTISQTWPGIWVI